MGHVVWQGRGTQHSAGQIMPITLTLKMGNLETNYSYQLTDPYGFFTVTVNGLPNGTYNWRAKGPTYMATTGTVLLTGTPITNLNMGQQKTGDLNGDNTVNIGDFNLLSSNFGQGGAPPIGPVKP